jgi:hypothetical protein
MLVIHVIERVSPATNAAQNSVRNCAERPTDPASTLRGHDQQASDLAAARVREEGEVVLAGRFGLERGRVTLSFSKGAAFDRPHAES